MVQQSIFSSEIRRLKNNEPLSEKNKLASLDPFHDENGIIRVGGRIRKAILSYSTRHPIVLPRSHHITELIIRRYHITNHHSGIQNTLCALRERFWPIDGRLQVRACIHKCVTCFGARPRIANYKMSDLPSVRIRENRAFNRVGVDYCGPFLIKEKRYKNKAFIKCYVSIFICMVTKAIHIEIVEDMTTEAFLGALRRFIGRRGVPQTIYSDNGTNFQGTKNALDDLYKLL
ncbi:uncharacterized protein LOC117181164 [Belonocnema kinseyi]|uniref:uncharacterized protein LOC117181164 n=1 Tax=Belonocnema kinseyi TaxID=2817044 RepID=UPI00143D3200|nr:uncharacterized protein LOC117181164 [Belonocnema kinseyi]